MPESTSKSHEVLPTGAQCRAARGLIGMTGAELAQAAGVTKSTVERFEQGHPATETTRRKIGEALNRRGIVFTNGNRPTVSLDLTRQVLPS